MVTSTTTQDTWYKNREKLKRSPIRPPERPKLQPIIHEYTVFGILGPGSEMAVNNTNILLAQIKLPHKF
ncbi:hypothetical protein KSS87_005309 [Heliosperma pusillum]|nr:hypothetical protein KSS87_005309 [Heliosperma pusillum]